MLPFLQAESTPSSVATPIDAATAQAAAVLLDAQHLAMLLMLVGLLVGGLRGRWKQRPDRLGVPCAPYHFGDLMLIVAILGFYYLIILQTTLSQMDPKDPAEAMETTGLSPRTSAILQFSISLFLHGIYIALIFSMVRLAQMEQTVRTATDLFGLKRLGPIGVVLWSIGGALIATPLVLSLMEPVKEWLLPIFGELNEQGAVAAFRENAGWNLETALLVITAVIVAPFAEELIFRGYLYGILKRFTDPMTACFVGSLLFAVAHINLPALLPLMFLAIFLTLLYEAARCLWVVVGVHALFNATNVAILLFGNQTAE